MDDERLILAIARLERAIGRVEAGAAAAPARSRDTAAREALIGLQARFDRLEQRHRALRAQAASTLAQIDRLIADASRAEPEDG